MIDCLHFEPWTKTAGKCKAGLFGGKPSHGTCAQCPDRNKPMSDIPKVFKTVWRNKDKNCPSCKPVVVGATP